MQDSKQVPFNRKPRRAALSLVTLGYRCDVLAKLPWHRSSVDEAPIAALASLLKK